MNVDWNNDQCMAQKNVKIKRRCHRKKRAGTDFCHYHNKSKKYYSTCLKKLRRKDLKEYNISTRKLNHSIKTELAVKNIKNIVSNLKIKLDKHTDKLNKENNHCLLGLYESWNDINYINRIELGSTWWDVYTIMFHFSQQINSVKMENPYPIYPSNPFNRKPIPVKDIIKLRDRIKLLEISINIALRFFLSQPIEKIQGYYDEAYKNEDCCSFQLLTDLYKSFRYRLINFKNSQNCFIGYWDYTKSHKSIFEVLYDELQNAPFQIYSLVHNAILPNPRREYLEARIDSLPKNTWTVNDHPLLPLL